MTSNPASTGRLIPKGFPNSPLGVSMADCGEKSRLHAKEVTSLVFTRACLRSSEAAGSRARCGGAVAAANLKLVRDDNGLTDDHADAHKRRLDLSGNMGEAGLSRRVFGSGTQ